MSKSPLRSSRIVGSGPAGMLISIGLFHRILARRTDRSGPVVERSHPSGFPIPRFCSDCAGYDRMDRECRTEGQRALDTMSIQVSPPSPVCCVSVDSRLRPGRLSQQLCLHPVGSASAPGMAFRGPVRGKADGRYLRAVLCRLSEEDRSVLPEVVVEVPSEPAGPSGAMRVRERPGMPVKQAMSSHVRHAGPWLRLGDDTASTRRDVNEPWPTTGT